MISEIINTNKKCKIDWQLSNVCNFDCPYCPDNVKNGSVGWPSFEKCKDTVDILNDKGICEITLSGGELTIWKHFNELCDYIKLKKNHNTYLITNGYKNEKYLSNLNVDKIFFSWHPTSPISIEKWCDKINNVKNKHKRVYVVMYPKVWDKVLEDFTYLKNNLYDFDSLEPKFVDNRAKINIKYNQDQLKFIEENLVLNFSKPNKPSLYAVINNKRKEVTVSGLITKNLNNFNNWTCEAGINNLVLRIDGSVYPTSGCNVGEQLGNWHNGFFQFRRTGLLCTQQTCWCGPDIMINKTYGKKQ